MDNTLYVVHRITPEEDAEVDKYAEILATQLGSRYKLAITIALEIAYLKGKHAGEQGIINDMKGLWEKSKPDEE